MTSSYTDPLRRHDFVLLFDCTDGNPNGDPDAGNAPRTDPETMQGLVTDVALKRKIRNYVVFAAEEEEVARAEELKIFVEHHGVLNNQIRRAYKALGISTGSSVTEPVKEMSIRSKLQSLNLPSGFQYSTNGESEEVTATLTYTGELSEAELKEALDALDDELDTVTRKFLTDVAKKSGKPEKTRNNVDRARKWMCQNFYDVRMFGAVMGTGLNAGQVRGPVQITFARSVDPIFPQDLAITRVAVTREEEREKLQTIGRKTLIPYGLYVAHGFFSPHLASQTGVGAADLELFWDALVNMWSLDRSASRGLMAPRGLYIFSHTSKLGNAPAHKLFERIQLRRKGEILSPRKFADYEVSVDDTDMPAEVTLHRLIEG